MIFIKNKHDLCVYKKISGSSIAYHVLYVDGILLIGNDVKMLGDVKELLSIKFSMKDMGEASYILCMSHWNSYIEKVLKRFKMKKKRGNEDPMRHGIKLSKKKSPKTAEELKRMLDIPDASAMGSIQYVVQCTRPDVAYAFERNE
ncbi:UNVERIFIED_CONTAM: Retrovirus-related Pol polyprotein from transposon RE1 [Sesamum angustifolium]|uniref:Retrovirus-related Pol polyprotein from transposon RE1 n=1 Tax=Sesamum angustifolium TaxID=2727405 RepID=A0AAW2ILI6_9LAMI